MFVCLSECFISETNQRISIKFGVGDLRVNLTREFSFVRFKVLTSAGAKMAVLWDVASCSPVETERFLPPLPRGRWVDDGGTKHLWNVGQNLRDYAVDNEEDCNFRIQFWFLSVQYKHTWSSYRTFFQKNLNVYFKISICGEYLVKFKETSFLTVLCD
jgi:hypothetical protein